MTYKGKVENRDAKFVVSLLHDAARKCVSAAKVQDCLGRIWQVTGVMKLTNYATFQKNVK